MARYGMGPLLESALRKTAFVAADEMVLVAAAFGADEDDGRLPLVLKHPTVNIRDIGNWERYKAVVGDYLYRTQAILEAMGLPNTPLYSANAIKVSASREQIEQLMTFDQLDMVELDPLVNATLMNDAIHDIQLPAFRTSNPAITGRGVKVAVLDSGIDLAHPYLRVAGSTSTNIESDAIPGDHGTHCAGSIASRDLIFPGVAPDVDLYNIKVLNRAGSGRHTDIVAGVDRALDFDVDVLSMSLGFNHLPTWSSGGHGWLCNDGHCPLCTAVDNAAQLDSKLVVVAAGNEHGRALALNGMLGGPHYDTELGCPGQARNAFTVGAVNKVTSLMAAFSSRGPSAYGLSKPDIVAPGVNITSTIPVPRDASGNLVPGAPRSAMFGRKSGTSMATPIVAGICALLIEQERLNSGTWSPLSVIAEAKRLARILPWPPNEAGAGLAKLL